MSNYTCLRPFLFRLDTERSHALAMQALRLGVVPPVRTRSYPVLEAECFGLRFPNPVGLAAGCDKNADVTEPMLKQGFGFVEAGTVTPLLQGGNPRPRMFRLVEDEAVINRLGFNNKGMEHARARLLARKREAGIVGINIGKNKDTENALDDYLLLLRELGALADYVTVNISSPNTVGLRDLQRRDALTALLEPLMVARDKISDRPPLLVKISPDMTQAELEDAAEVMKAMKVDGIIVSNTTVSRPESLQSDFKGEMGGLSGRPLMPLATETLRQMYRLTQGKIPLIGVGGVSSPQDAIAKIRAGASLVQLYTALVYQGMGLVERIKQGLADEVQRAGVASVADLVGKDS